MEQGLRDLVANKVTAPARHHVDFGVNTLLTMPVIAEEAFGVKMVSVVPSNATRDLPVVNGLMILSDGVTGAPLAVLSAAALTGQRTGAVGALGLKHTTPPNVDRLGIIGIGVQGTWQAIFACAVRPIHTINFLARSDERARRFIDNVTRAVPSVRLTRCADVQELLGESAAIIAATTSSTPVLPDDRSALRNKHFVSVGSFKPSMQELPNSVYELSQQVVIDSDAAKFEAGDLIGPVVSGLLQEQNIIHVADIVAGKRTIDTARTTVFKSVGMAIYDLYAAQAFLAGAQRLHRGTPLES